MKEFFETMDLFIVSRDLDHPLKTYDPRIECTVDDVSYIYFVSIIIYFFGADTIAEFIDHVGINFFFES